MTQEKLLKACTEVSNRQFKANITLTFQIYIKLISFQVLNYISILLCEL